MARLITLLLLSIVYTHLKAETLTAVADPWPPYVAPDIPEQGLSTQIVRAALKREGFDLQLQFMPWARALRRVKNGEADLLVAAWWTEERAGYLHFSEPYAQNHLKFIKLKDDPFEFEGLQSLQSKRIGIVRDYGYSDSFRDADNYLQVENNSFAQNMRMLVAGRIDLTVEDEWVAITTLRKEAPEQLAKIAFSRNPLLTKQLYMASGRNHPRHQQIVDAFNRGLGALRADGTLERLLEQMQQETTAPQ